MESLLLLFVTRAEEPCAAQRPHSSSGDYREAPCGSSASSLGIKEHVGIMVPNGLALKTTSRNSSPSPTLVRQSVSLTTISSVGKFSSSQSKKGSSFRISGNCSLRVVMVVVVVVGKARDQQTSSASSQRVTFSSLQATGLC